VKTIFFDVDTQLDFLYPAGALYVPGAEEIVLNLAALTRHAAQCNVQILSTADAHSEDDPEFKIWKPHCVAGTAGQTKAAATLLGTAKVLDKLDDDASSMPQIIVEKQQLDAFSNPRLRPLLAAISADRYVLYGVVTELCVRCAALGLLQMGGRVELVTDAIKSLSSTDEQSFIKQFQEQDGVLTNTAQVISE
jgi:nicotinamidase/pyrazinamidase